MADAQRPAPAGPIPAGPPGYVIRPPQASPQAAAPSAGAAPGAAAVAVPAAGEPVPDIGLTPSSAVIGVAALLAAAAVIFVLRGAVRSHLIANRSTLSGANGAGWALFAFLLCLAATVIFGVLGQLWTVLSFVIPLGVLCLVTLVLFVMLYASASRAAR